MKTIPDSHDNRQTFFTDLLAEIIQGADTLGWDAEKIAAVTALLQPIITVYNTLVAAENAVSEASADASKVYGQLQSQVLDLLEELRANPKATGAMLAAMKLLPTAVTRDVATIKPSLTLKAEPGHVRITGSKDYAELVNIYMRRAGQTVWMQIAVNRKKFPFDDQTPLLVVGLPEVREYKARGVIDDQEIGLESDIVTVAFAE